jgi:predicted O-methyltransferase YrrM
MPVRRVPQTRSAPVTAKSTFIDAATQEYVIDVTVREPAILRELRDETARMPNATMQIGPEQGQLMQLLARLIDAKRYLEVGVFTGYSALAMALALPDDGRVVACDISEEYTSIARRYWKRAGVEGKIDLRLAPALATLDALLASGEAGCFDFAFVDADKENVEGYYERALQLVRVNGLVLIDNVLWSGRVLDPSTTDPETVALRALNRKVARDERVDSSLLTVCDGILVVRKR